MECCLEHRGFRGSASFNPCNGQHYGLVLDIADGIVYESWTAEDLIANFETAVDEYLAYLEERSGNESASIALVKPVVAIVGRGAEQAA